MADSTEIGIESFNEQEKSTINIESDFIGFLVIAYVNILTKKLYGTNVSARCSNLLSTEDFSFQIPQS